MTSRITSVGVLQCGKLLAFFYGIIGLIVAPFYILTGLISGDGGAFIVFLVIAAVSVIMYPVFGFIGGIIFSALYNLAANVMGGFEITLEQDAE